ncbi:hypothetical protein GQ44DRAFT_781590 [Phaeosphaeriaceae sp. PMI808]|nr:hypothetical protein GQ44DRAFT_781590 [Phaeosphaeriaceae sp. PMI808]
MPPQSTWIMLPCTLISILIASPLLSATPFANDKGLTAVFKIAFVFVTVFMLTATTTKIFLSYISHNDTGSEEGDYPISFTEGLRQANLRNLDTCPKVSVGDRVRTWGQEVLSAQEEPHWAASIRANKFTNMWDRLRVDPHSPSPHPSVMIMDEEIRDEQKQKSKKIWNSLYKEFKPNKKALLGKKKEANVEVVAESPYERGKAIRMG